MKKYLSLLILTAFLGFGCCETDENGDVTSPFLEFFKDENAVISYLNVPSGGYKFPEVPAEFASKTMPAGKENDAEFIALGKRVYDGLEVEDVACKTCHGADAVPLMSGARDFRDPAFIDNASDAFLYWRVWMGVEETPMAAWGDDYDMTPEQVWAVIAYLKTFKTEAAE